MLSLQVSLTATSFPASSIDHEWKLVVIGPGPVHQVGSPAPRLALSLDKLEFHLGSGRFGTCGRLRHSNRGCVDFYTAGSGGMLKCSSGHRGPELHLLCTYTVNNLEVPPTATLPMLPVPRLDQRTHAGHSEVEPWSTVHTTFTQVRILYLSRIVHPARQARSA